MRSKVTKLVAGITAVTALAVGGVSIAGAASNTPPVNPPAAVDADTTQSGDQTAPDAAGAAAESSSEAASSEAASSESAAASDGPGGYADDPANANADTQFEGVQ
jgi:hypothetical protein